MGRKSTVCVRLADGGPEYKIEIDGTPGAEGWVFADDGTVRGQLVRDAEGVWLVSPDGDSGELVVVDPGVNAPAATPSSALAAALAVVAGDGELLNGRFLTGPDGSILGELVQDGDDAWVVAPDYLSAQLLWGNATDPHAWVRTEEGWAAIDRYEEEFNALDEAGELSA